MEQLVMRWKNDGTQEKRPTTPSGCEIANFTQIDQPIDKWLDIVQYGLTNGRKNQEYYHREMTSRPYYDEKNCFFIIEKGEAVATLAVICDPIKKEGYIHMVACKETCRGKGYGTLLNEMSIYTLKSQGMETAYLTTDDWRIPAIKSYLTAGFTADLSTDDFKERWSKIMAQLKK